MNLNSGEEWQMKSDGVDTGETLQETIFQLIAAGGTIGDVCEFSDEDYEAVYVLGHNFYSQGRYSDALKAFGYLMINNHMDRRFAFSFAASCQMLKRYEEAVRCYALAAAMDPDDPAPTFHIAECLVSLGMVDEAIGMFEVAIEECGPQHDDMKTRAIALHAMLLKRK